ncbi:hypothetical protein IW261DRAFT_1508534 [Armillaria novae-zelandiae]|uniref:Uncharacterized protein n=1 Tax=Armillaria novae-zelandiae TaxID=153914 RepID=A0AA39NV42_9AGAR|nr:hypothetical protein IW261DRAFT_1508534 [Armillaria novae-zelandiae]
MNVQTGTIVFFYGSAGQIVQGVVQETSRLGDGAQILRIKIDNGTFITLPTAAIFHN